MKPKNTICLWYDKDALEAANFYAATLPDSKVTAVHKAPSDYPNGRKGDVLTVAHHPLRRRGFVIHVAGVVMTSCPGPTPHASRAMCKADVPLLRPMQCRTPR